MVAQPPATPPPAPPPLPPPGAKSSEETTGKTITQQVSESVPGFSAQPKASPIGQPGAPSTVVGPPAGKGSGGTTQTATTSITSQTPTTSTPSTTITQNPAGTGLNQLPSSIAGQLQSGQLSSWVNPNTGQTFYAPGTVNNGPAFAGKIWVSGPNGAGPIDQSIGGQTIQITGPTQTQTTSTGTVTSPLNKGAPGTLQQPSFGAIPSLIDFSTFATSLTSGHNSGTISNFQNLGNNQFSYVYTDPQSNQQITETIYIPVSMGGFGSQSALNAAISSAWDQYVMGQTNPGQSVNTPSGPITITHTPAGSITGSTMTNAPPVAFDIGTGQFTISPVQGFSNVDVQSLINSGMLNSKMINQLSDTGTTTINGKIYTKTQLEQIYDTIYTQYAQNNPAIISGSTGATTNAVDTYITSLAYTGPGDYYVYQPGSTSPTLTYISNPAFVANLVQNGGSISTPTSASSPATLIGGGSANVQFTRNGWQFSNPTNSTTPTQYSYSSNDGLTNYTAQINPTTGEITVQGQLNNNYMMQPHSLVFIYSNPNNPNDPNNGQTSFTRPGGLQDNWYVISNGTDQTMSLQDASKNVLPLTTANLPNVIGITPLEWTNFTQNVGTGINQFASGISNFVQSIGNIPSPLGGTTSTPIGQSQTRNVITTPPIGLNAAFPNEWLPAQPNGIYFNPVTNEFWNTNPNEIAGVPGYSSTNFGNTTIYRGPGLPPGVKPTTMANLIQQYVTNPITQTASAVGNALEPTIQSASQTFQNAASNISNNQIPSAFNLTEWPGYNKYIAQPIENYLNPSFEQRAANQIYANYLNQQIGTAAQQGLNFPLANGYKLSLNPGFYAARIETIPGATQNIAENLYQLSQSGKQFFGGSPAKENYYTNPVGTIYSQAIGQVPTYLSQISNEIFPGNDIFSGIGRGALTMGVTTPASGISSAISGLTGKTTGALPTLLNLGTIGASAWNPGKSFMFGLGNELFGAGINAITGQQIVANTLENYKIGVTLAPAFDIASRLGEALANKLFPSYMAAAARTVEREVALNTALEDGSPQAITAFEGKFGPITAADRASGGLSELEANLITRNLGLKAAVAKGIYQSPIEEANLLGTGAFKAFNPEPLVSSLGRLAVRQAPVNLLFGGLSSGTSYISGNRDPISLATQFGLGYALGSALQTTAVIADSLFSKGKSELAVILNKYNPLDQEIFDVRDFPLFNENGQPYYLRIGKNEAGAPEGTAYYLSKNPIGLITTEQLYKAIVSGTKYDALPSELQSALLSNARIEGMSPEEYYTSLIDSIKQGQFTATSVTSATEFPQGIIKGTEQVKPPSPKNVADAIRGLYLELNGLYNAPTSTLGIVDAYNKFNQISYNYADLRPDLMGATSYSQGGTGGINFLIKRGELSDLYTLPQFLADNPEIDGARVQAETKALSSFVQNLLNSDNTLSMQDAVNNPNAPDTTYARKVLTLYNDLGLNDKLELTSIRHSTIGQGEMETMSPVVRAGQEQYMQATSHAPIISVEPNYYFQGTPLENIFPTYRFGLAVYWVPGGAKLQANQVEALADLKAGNVKSAITKIDPMSSSDLAGLMNMQDNLAVTGAAQQLNLGEEEALAGASAEAALPNYYYYNGTVPIGPLYRYAYQRPSTYNYPIQYAYQTPYTYKYNYPYQYSYQQSYPYSYSYNNYPYEYNYNRPYNYNYEYGYGYNYPYSYNYPYKYNYGYPTPTSQPTYGGLRLPAAGGREEPLYTARSPLYAASVSSLLFPSLNEIASETYNPLLAGIGLRPIPTSASPTIQQPLAVPASSVQTPMAKPAPTASVQSSTGAPLDMPTTGTETPIEIQLAQAINQNQAQQALNGGTNPYNNMLNSALNAVRAQNTQARIAQNFQNSLYLQSIYNSLARSGLSEAQIRAMLNNAYNMASGNTSTANAQVAAIAEPSLASLANQKKNPLLPVVNPRGPINPGMLQTPIQTSAVGTPTLQTSTVQSQAAATPSLPTINLANINPNEFLETTSPYSSLPPALATTPIIAQTEAIKPAASRSGREIQLARLAA